MRKYKSDSCSYKVVPMWKCYALRFNFYAISNEFRYVNKRRVACAAQVGQAVQLQMKLGTLVALVSVHVNEMLLKLIPVHLLAKSSLHDIVQGVIFCRPTTPCYKKEYE